MLPVPGGSSQAWQPCRRLIKISCFQSFCMHCHSPPTFPKTMTHWERPWFQKRLWAEGATQDELVGWHHRLNGHELSKLREIVKGREAWHGLVQGAAKSWTRLSDWTTKGIFNSSGLHYWRGRIKHSHICALDCSEWLESVKWNSYECLMSKELQIVIRPLLLPNLHFDAFTTCWNESAWVNQQKQLKLKCLSDKYVYLDTVFLYKTPSL